MNILIIGGSGGIGSALIEAFLSLNSTINIYTTYSTKQNLIASPKVKWFKVDLQSETDIEMLSSQIPKLDVLINAAGFLHDSDNLPEKTINAFNMNFFQKNILSNTTPTILLAKHFSKQLKSHSKSHFIAISARIGSIEDNRSGGWISYRCSKSALNMAIKTISIEWQFKSKNCCVLAFHPGTTDTEFSKPYQKNVPIEKLFTPKYASEQLLKLIRQTKPSDSGQFYSFDGTKIPW